MGAPNDHDTNIVDTTAAQCFPKPDPPVSELSASTGLPAWVDPILEELTASLVVSHLAGAIELGRPPPPTATSQETTNSSHV